MSRLSSSIPNQPACRGEVDSTVRTMEAVGEVMRQSRTDEAAQSPFTLFRAVNVVFNVKRSIKC